ncbi:MAG TPA: SpoIID/LytB domain-containing protein [Actinomycetota bacterium]|nr:SpoIID/LytB domain-containing protein [Actinomycetota bacterium]
MKPRLRWGLALLVFAATAAPIGFRTPAAARSGASAAAPRAGDQAPVGPITFTPASPGASDTVDAIFPSVPGLCPPNQPQPVVAAFPGTLEVGREPNGRLYLITQLSFADYLKGIAEVPTSWPLAALEAQVVAARTYAISHLNGSTVDGLHYDLCSTDACQVYRGESVQNGPYGDRWVQAVNDTAGQILEYQGKPIDALYFSTSNGHTYSNATVFNGPPLPYLQPVVENDDGASPTSNWTVRMPLTDLAQALNLAGQWGTGAITTVSQQGTNIAISGPGQSKTLPVSTFRNSLNNQADCLTPKRYPSAATGGGHLPQTVPSIWMTLTQQADAVVMTGRGWGHGVGMVQWGAEGKAAKGQSYQQILAYYYGGLQPVTVPEPGSIRILLATGVQQVTVAPGGSVQVSGGPSGVSGAVTITGGSSLTIAPAPGPGGAIPPTVTISGVSASATAATGTPATFSFNLNHAANVSIEYTGPGVTGTGSTTPAPVTGGAASVTWDPAGAGLAPGAYQAAVVADDGVSRVVSEGVTVTLKAPPPPSPSPSPSTPGRRPPASPKAAGPAKKSSSTSTPWFLAGALVLALAVGAGAAVLLTRGGPQRS